MNEIWNEHNLIAIISLLRKVLSFMSEVIYVNNLALTNQWFDDLMIQRITMICHYNDMSGDIKVVISNSNQILLDKLCVYYILALI